MRFSWSFALSTLLLLGACAPSTKVVQSWRDPNTTIQQGHYKKLLCIALVKDEVNRRAAEDKLVSMMPGRAVQSYNYLGALPDTMDRQRFSTHLAASGFDGVVIMRLARKEKDVSYVAGTYPGAYYSTWGYYGYARPYYSDPGYIRTDDYYFIETNLYDLGGDKLVWSSMTSSWEPSSVSQVVGEVVQAVHDRMVAEGFITIPPSQEKK